MSLVGCRKCRLVTDNNITSICPYCGGVLEAYLLAAPAKEPAISVCGVEVPSPILEVRVDECRRVYKWESGVSVVLDEPKKYPSMKTGPISSKTGRAGSM